MEQAEQPKPKPAPKSPPLFADFRKDPSIWRERERREPQTELSASRFDDQGLTAEELNDLERRVRMLPMPRDTFSELLGWIEGRRIEHDFPLLPEDQRQIRQQKEAADMIAAFARRKGVTPDEIEAYATKVWNATRPKKTKGDRK